MLATLCIFVAKLNKMNTETVEVTGNGITVNVTVPIDLLLGKEVDFGNGAIMLPENKKQAIEYVGYIQEAKVPISMFDIDGVEYRRVETPENLLEEMPNMVGIPNLKEILFQKQNIGFGASRIKIVNPNK